MKKIFINLKIMIRYLKKFFEPAFKEKKVTIKAIVPAFISSTIWILSVYLLKEITNKISEWWDNSIYILLTLFIISTLFFYVSIIITKNWTHVTIWPKFRNVLYKKYINYYIFLDNNESEKIGTGKMIAMIDKWLHSWVSLLEKSLVEVLSNILFIIFSFIFIGFINIYYFFIIFILFITVFIITILLQTKAKKYRILRRDSNIGITKKFVNILMSKFEILQNWKSNKEILYISEQLDDNIYYNSKVMNYNIVGDLLMKVLIDGSKVWIILMFGIWLLNTTINFWEFVSLMSIIYILDQIFTKSINTFIDFTKIIVDVEKLWDFFDNTPQIKWYEEWNKFSHKKWEIDIEKLNFWYGENKNIFTDFSLNIAWEKILALVWDSGSGKSTLAKMVAGYMRPDSWDIIVDNQKLSETSLKSYYKDVWYLTQDPSVFDGSILENLTYALEEKISDVKIKEIITQAKCEFIYDLPNWLETEIWERWVKLSGGQKQRLAIAKIFLKDPKIIILDEPTSALDSFSEEQITKAMQNLFENRTVIVIAHRLQTVKHAHRILVLENGKILEDGNHESLIKKDWKYAKMLELQSGF